ncbi:MAG: metal-dependent hydrolase, partial [Pseudomonadota bacterium]
MSESHTVDPIEFEHPMDNIPVRPLDFQAEKLGTDAVMWSQSCPEFAIFLNAFSVHVPYFERYLIRSMSVAKKHVKDEKLLKDMSAIIGQEAHHAKNFIEFNRKMAAKYPKIDALEMHAKDDFVRRAKTDDLQTLAGFTAGYETFTFLAGMIILANYEKWMGDSDPTMKAMWVWHQVEEVEHGAVAFDVYKDLFGEKEWYRKYMILKALLHIGWEVFKAYFHMAKHEGFLKTPLRAVKTTWF